jgi:type II secretory pathway component GspD/PulD (secretin)
MSRRTPTILGLFIALAIASAPGFAQVGGDEPSGRGKGYRQHLSQFDDAKTSSSQKSPNANLINLNFLDTDIRDALSALAMDQEINIATAKEVSGKISIHLFQVTLEEALRAITQAGGFSLYKHGEIYYVYKPKLAQDPEIDRLQTRIFKLKYADINKVKDILSTFPGIRTIKFHEPSKTIFLEDTPETIKKIETIIANCDTMPKQVMIEAKILEINLTDDMSLGVEWSAILGDARIGTSSFSNAVLPQGEDVSPVPETGSGLFFNILTGSSSRQFAAAIDALQEKTKVNTLSTPKVLAIHGQPAKVQVGGQQGYTVTTTNLGVSTETIEFIDTGIVLEIVPYIEDDGNVLLNVKPSVTSAELEEGIPVTRTAFVETWLLAKSGDTVLIGGLIQDNLTRTRSEVPCFGNIPLFGLLFGQRGRKIDKVELVLLITPQIVNMERKTQDEVEAIMKAKDAEADFKKEPLPPYRQIFEFLSPWDRSADVDAGASEKPSPKGGDSNPTSK